ncbi:hypothetical protein OB955_04880 [Halobacteria archaeon AArc-m2/3/4]|uniref:Uncharacterized protein n=1 Tax=Natronoglomus mannanivorans TaxID=2979990 RepID=A0ABT2QAV4_9EURY|nr:hypothetical protein [Halobacteria archaeon AArc-m2/3/4]
MYTDDSRGLESPDQSDVSNETIVTRALPDGGTDALSRYRLQVIDRQARKLLETIGEDSDATRHCREIRAEVEYVRRELFGFEFESNDLETDPTTVPMIVDRGELVTTCLGPDPDAYVREHGVDERERGDSDD